MTKEKIISLMEKRNYNFVKEAGFTMYFVKSNDVYSKNNIICEVFPDTNTNNDTYRFIYTNNKMLGMLNSGILKHLDSEIEFNDYEDNFSVNVSLLKKGMRIPWDE